MNKHTFFAVIFLLINSVLLYFSTTGEYFFSALIASIAYISMALSLILAGRFEMIDNLLGGADKSYRAHRYLGYTSLSAGIVHWLTGDDAFHAIVPSLSDSAGDLGEFAIIALIALVTISIFKLIPYQWWKKSHLLMGPLFILIAIHVFFSASPVILLSPLWWLLACVTLLAVIAWIKTLCKPINSPIKGKVIDIAKTEKAIDFTIAHDGPLTWKPGQFAQLSINKENLKEQHPFSFANACDHSNDSHHARFIINRAGDYTKALYETLEIDDELLIHRIAGGFTPQISTKRERQIWVAAGSGITPFLAALDALHADHHAQIDLIYNPGKGFDKHLSDTLKQYQKKLPQLKLTLLSNGEYLTQQHFTSLSVDWKKADLYLCGPEKMKQSAQQIWRNNSAKGKIHTEFYDFRGAISITQLPWLRVLELIKLTANKVATCSRFISLINATSKLNTEQFVLTKRKY